MRKWWPLAAVSLGSALFLLDTTVVNVALPAMARDLTASLPSLEWVLNIYTLVLATLMLTAGSLADRYGHRTVYLAGLAVFSAASLACALAPDVGLLITARGVQGIGGAAMAVTSFSLLGASYTGKELSTALGLWFAVCGLAGAAGPMFGGVFVETLGWRAIFLLNLPLGILTFVVSRYVLPDTKGKPSTFDPAGMTSFAVCAGALTYALTESGWKTAAGSVAAALALAVFIFVELRHPHPLLDLALFRTTSFSVTLWCGMASSGAFACLTYTSIELQTRRGLSPIHTGLALIPLSLGIFVASTLSGRLLHDTSPRLTVGLGLLLSGVGCALQAWLNPSLLPGLIVTGIGVGVVMPAMGGAVMAAVPPERAGMAAGAMTTARQLGQTLGVALFGAVFEAAGGLNAVYLTAGGLGAAAGVAALVFIRPRRRAAVSLDV